MTERFIYKILKGSAIGLFVITFSTISSNNAHAEASLLFGQKHAYTAVVREDTKVVTYGKIFLTNPDTKPLKNTSFSIPSGIHASTVSIYQITLPERCKDSFKLNKPDESSVRSPYQQAMTCAQLEAQAYNFDQYGYYGYYTGEYESQLLYKKITPKVDGQNYTFGLPKPIEQGERGAYLVSFVATEGYVTGTFGLYNLQFKTLQVSDSLEEVRVSVDVSADFYTKSDRSGIEVGGRDDASLSPDAQVTDGNIQGKSLDRLQSNIGLGGAFTKTGKALEPNEIFVVNGQFADSTWKLNLWWIISIFGGLLAALLAAGLLMRKAHKTHNKHSKGGKYDSK